MSYQKLQEFIYRPLVEGDRHQATTLSALEKAIGRPVPVDFAEFLSQFPDTGIFEVEGVVFIASEDRLSGRHDGRFAIETLFAACSDERYDLLTIRRKDALNDSTRTEFLRIGDDSFGNAFLLDLRDEGFGKVYFWDHEAASSESTLHLVAPDFSEFVDRLQVDAR